MANKSPDEFTWNPELYLRFGDERGRPARDLLARLAGLAVTRALDLGCGPGNSAAAIRERWPAAAVVGVDSSASMLARAGEAVPDAVWHCRDAAADLRDLGDFDLVFSNAALHWLPCHHAVIPAWFALVRPGGALAVQVPNNPEGVMHRAIADAVRSPRWRVRFPDGFREIYRPAGHFYGILAALAGRLALWETIYYQAMPSLDAVVDWYRGSQLRQYLGKLEEEESGEFLADLRARAAPGFPAQPDGTVLFPFRRLFFTVAKV